MLSQNLSRRSPTAPQQRSVCPVRLAAYSAATAQRSAPEASNHWFGKNGRFGIQQLHCPSSLFMAGICHWQMLMYDSLFQEVF